MSHEYREETIAVGFRQATYVRPGARPGQGVPIKNLSELLTLIEQEGWEFVSRDLIPIVLGGQSSVAVVENGVPHNPQQAQAVPGWSLLFRRPAAQPCRNGQSAIESLHEEF